MSIQYSDKGKEFNDVSMIGDEALSRKDGQFVDLYHWVGQKSLRTILFFKERNQED